MKKFAFFFFIILMLSSVVFAADGAQNMNTWQIIAGVFAFFTTGAGAWIFRNIGIAKDLREAITAIMSALVAIRVFVAKAPKVLYSIPEFVEMLKKVDKAFEESADILKRFPATKKYSFVLRDTIQIREDGKFKASKSIEKLVKDNIVIKSFDEAMENLKQD